MKLKLIRNLMCLTLTINAGSAWAQGVKQGLAVNAEDAKIVDAEKSEDYNPAADKTVKVDDKDPLKGIVDVPDHMRYSKYLGFSYQGIPGCQRLAGYYGFAKVSYLGPYLVPAHYEGGYWWGYYWVPVYWVPTFSVTYCYGVK